MAKYLMFVCLFLALAVKAEKFTFDYYQSILDRMMFGRPPSNFDPTKNPSEVTKQSEKELTKEQEQIKSAIHFSVINVTPSGKTAVGFTDNSDPKAPVSYYLKEGECSGGWTVKAADALKAWMKIEKNGIEVELTLGANSATGGGTTSKVSSSTPALSSSSTSSSGSLRIRGTGLLSRNSPGSSMSFAQRKAEREAKRLEEEKRHEEEKAKQEAEREEMKADLAQMKEQIANDRKRREVEAEEKAKSEAEAKVKANAQDQGEDEGEENEGGEE